MLGLTVPSHVERSSGTAQGNATLQRTVETPVLARHRTQSHAIIPSVQACSTAKPKPFKIVIYVLHLQLTPTGSLGESGLIAASLVKKVLSSGSARALSLNMEATDAPSRQTVKKRRIAMLKIVQVRPCQVYR